MDTKVDQMTSKNVDVTDQFDPYKNVNMKKLIHTNCHRFILLILLYMALLQLWLGYSTMRRSKSISLNIYMFNKNPYRRSCPIKKFTV